MGMRYEDFRMYIEKAQRAVDNGKPTVKVDTEHLLEMAAAFSEKKVREQIGSEKADKLFATVKAAVSENLSTTLGEAEKCRTCEHIGDCDKGKAMREKHGDVWKKIEAAGKEAFEDDASLHISDRETCSKSKAH